MVDTPFVVLLDVPTEPDVFAVADFNGLGLERLAWVFGADVAPLRVVVTDPLVAAKRELPVKKIRSALSTVIVLLKGLHHCQSNSRKSLAGWCCGSGALSDCEGAVPV